MIISIAIIRWKTRQIIAFAIIARDSRGIIAIEIIQRARTVMAIRNAKDFGTAIRERRKRLGYTQGELAEMCDVGVMFVSQLENGKPTAQLDKAIRVANMVGLNIVLQERR
jgi:y4mF family transcriptional regulator